MYRRSKKYQLLRARIAASVAARERKRIQTASDDDFELDLPDLRKKIEITEFDNDGPKTTVLELYQSDRIDCYRVMVNGKLWKERIGMSKILEGIRKALPRRMRFTNP